MRLNRPSSWKLRPTLLGPTYTKRWTLREPVQGYDTVLASVGHKRGGCRDARPWYGFIEGPGIKDEGDCYATVASAKATLTRRVKLAARRR